MAGATQIVQGPTVNPTFVQAHMTMPAGGQIGADTIDGFDSSAVTTSMMLEEKGTGIAALFADTPASFDPTRVRDNATAPALSFDGRMSGVLGRGPSTDSHPLKGKDILGRGSREPSPIEVLLARADKPIIGLGLEGIVINGLNAVDLDDTLEFIRAGSFVEERAKQTGESGRGLLTWSIKGRSNKLARALMKDGILWANQYLSGKDKLSTRGSDRDLIENYLEAGKFMRFLMALSISKPEDQDKPWVQTNLAAYDPLRKSRWLGHYKSACMTIEPDKFKLLFPQFATDFDHLNISTSAQRTAQIAVGTKRIGTPVPFELDDITATVNDGTRFLLLFILDHMMERKKPEEMPPYVEPLTGAFATRDTEYLIRTIASALGKYIYIAHKATNFETVEFVDIGGLTEDETKVMMEIGHERIGTIILGMLNNLPRISMKFMGKGDMTGVVRDAVAREIDRNPNLTKNDDILAWAGVKKR